MASEYVGKALSLYNATSLDAYTTTALSWARGHPVQAGMVGLNVGLTPFFGLGWMGGLALKALGFGKAGVGAGTVAAWWQATAYRGYIPAGSIFAAFQAWGATWGFW